MSTSLLGRNDSQRESDSSEEQTYGTLLRIFDHVSKRFLRRYLCSPDGAPEHLSKGTFSFRRQLAPTGPNWRAVHFRLTLWCDLRQRRSFHASNWTAKVQLRGKRSWAHLTGFPQSASCVFAKDIYQTARNLRTSPCLAICR